MKHDLTVTNTALEPGKPAVVAYTRGLVTDLAVQNVGESDVYVGTSPEVSAEGPTRGWLLPGRAKGGEPSRLTFPSNPRAWRFPALYAVAPEGGDVQFMAVSIEADAADHGGPNPLLTPAPSPARAETPDAPNPAPPRVAPLPARLRVIDGSMTPLRSGEVLSLDDIHSRYNQSQPVARDTVDRIIRAKLSERALVPA